MRSSVDTPGLPVAKAGFIAIIPSGWTRTIIFIVLAPLIGMFVGPPADDDEPVGPAPQTPRRVDWFFRKMQLVSAAAFSLMHGANDAQKTMGIIAGALFTGGFLNRDAGGKLPIPYWVISWPTGRCAGNVVRRVAHHQDHGHEDHEAATDWRVRGGDRGRPGHLLRRRSASVSTTHTITGAIIGVGSSKRLSAVRWGVAQQNCLGVVLTIPASAFIGASRTKSSGSCSATG